MKFLPLFIILIGNLLQGAFQMVPSLEDSPIILLGYYLSRAGVYIILVLIIHHLITQLFRLNRIILPLIILFVLFLINAIRNIPVFGLQSFGEMLYSYQYIVPAIYLMLILDNEKDRLNFLKILVIFSLLPILLFPLVGHLKQWQVQDSEVFAQSGRYFPSSISLGILYGTATTLLFWYKGIWKIGLATITILVILSFGMILWDGHRSVWLVLTCMLVIALSFGILKINGKLLIYFLIIAPISIFIVFKMTNMGALIESRTLAIINPTSDRTASFRLLSWSIYFSRFLEVPISGEGFGAMWSAFIPGFGTIIASPHNLYIQLLVKTGLVGALIYIIAVVKYIQRLYRDNRKKMFMDAIFGSAFVIFVASHAYYLVYSLEFITWMYLGIGISHSIYLGQGEKNSN
jgi:O-antigen ligase